MKMQKMREHERVRQMNLNKQNPKASLGNGQYMPPGLTNNQQQQYAKKKIVGSVSIIPQLTNI